MTQDITIQYAVPTTLAPTASQLRYYAKTVLQHLQIKQADITIRIIDADEMKQLNGRYRGKHYATNILSFPHDRDPLIGDIAICASIVNEEAAAQHKSIDAHWAHLTIHGTLHLLGFDHIDPAEAMRMEKKEISILAELHFANPYEESH